MRRKSYVAIGRHGVTGAQNKLQKSKKLILTILSISLNIVVPFEKIPPVFEMLSKDLKNPKDF